MPTPCIDFGTIPNKTSYPVYNNVTTIAQRLCTPPICTGPVSIEDCNYFSATDSCSTPCSTSIGSVYEPCACAGGQVSFPGIAGWGGNNCYQATGAKITPGSCAKWGFKNVQAFKGWQGAAGFQDDCPNVIDSSNPSCSYLSLQSSPPTTRYLTATATMTATGVIVSAPDPNCEWITTTINFSSTVTVDRYSGNATVTTTNTCTAVDNLEGPVACASYTPLGWLSPCPLAQTLTSVADALGLGYIGTATTTVSETELTYSFAQSSTIRDCVGLSFLGLNVTASLVLSNPYTSDEVESDCEAALGYWDLTNDLQYPWRTDTAVSQAPLVTYDETVNSPMGYLGLASQTVGTNTGAILGRPTPVGYAPFWDAAHANYVEGFGGDPFAWVVQSWGAFPPPYIPQQATQWTNLYNASGLYGGAYSGISGGNSGISGVTPTFPFYVVPSSTLPPAPIYGAGCFKQKWAETILFAKRAHNWARPCGTWQPYDLLGSTAPAWVNDRAAIDQNTINCTSNPNGTLRWPNAPCDCDNATNNPGPAYPTPCPSPTGVTPNAWNTDVGKGDYVTRLFTYNARDVGEYARINSIIGTWACGTSPSPPSLPTYPRGGSPLANLVCTQQNASTAKCPPYVICISPNGESFANGLTIAMPHIGLDWDYGSFWYCDVLQWMLDPLWQPPASPDCTGTIWKQDNGSCTPCVTVAGTTTCYYFPPFEECRCTLPSGAPALPAGITLGVSSPTSGFPTGPLSGPPIIGGVGVLCPWSFWIEQLATGCHVGD